MSHERPGPAIIEATPETFERDAIERSREVPVVVDFWAEWCGPCRQLGPVLERLAEEYGGRFVLVKADTERLGEAAAAFGVRSIPAVYALKGGQVVDGFVGAQPESLIRSFLDRLMPTPQDELIAEAKALESSDPEGAEGNYRAAMLLEPDDYRPKVGLAGLLRTQGRVDEALALIEQLERRGFLEPEAERMKAELTLGKTDHPREAVAAARAALDARPEDLSLRLELARALAAAGEYPEALEICLDLVERDRRGVGEEARKTMLAIFQVVADDTALVNDYRRRLSLVL